MAQMKSAMILSLERVVPELDVAFFLEKLLGAPVFSDTYQSLDANIFLDFSEYEQGFRQSIFLSWPDDIDLKLSPRQIASAMSSEFDVRILLRTEEGFVDHWPLFEPGLPQRDVSVREIGDSITYIPR